MAISNIFLIFLLFFYIHGSHLHMHTLPSILSWYVVDAHILRCQILAKLRLLEQGRALLGSGREHQRHLALSIFLHLPFVRVKTHCTSFKEFCLPNEVLIRYYCEVVSARYDTSGLHTAPDLLLKLTQHSLNFHSPFPRSLSFLSFRTFALFSLSSLLLICAFSNSFFFLFSSILLFLVSSPYSLFFLSSSLLSVSNLLFLLSSALFAPADGAFGASPCSCCPSIFISLMKSSRRVLIFSLLSSSPSFV